MAGGAETYQRYTAGAIMLHWLIASLIVFQIGFGLWLAEALHAESEAMRAAAFEQTQIHKSVGLTVLALTVIRILWRLLHPAPPLPSTMKWYEKTGSHLSHSGFYALMLLMPLTGWAMVSASVQFGSIPTIYFGLFTIPHLPVLPELAAEMKTQAEDAFQTAHLILAYGAIALLLLHVAAALKHHFRDKDTVLARMTPFVKPSGGLTARAFAPSISPARAGAGAILAGFAGAGLMSIVFLNMPDQAAGTAATTQSAPPAAATDPALWVIDDTASTIRFSGTHTGNPFTGTFENWTAEIRFNPDTLEESSVRVDIDLASAKTGNALYDGTLPQGDWFNISEHPAGVFEASTFTFADGDYQAEGSLTLRGVTEAVSFPFDLTISPDGTADMRAILTLDRTSFGIGIGPDATGAWVSKEIEIEISVQAQQRERGES